MVLEQHNRKEIGMKLIEFENRLTKEKFTCKNPYDVRIVDNVEFITVQRYGTTRDILMRKDALVRINTPTR